MGDTAERGGLDIHNAELVRDALTYQRLRRAAQQQADEATRLRLSAEAMAAAEVIWQQLRDDLCKRAGRWLGGPLGEETHQRGAEARASIAMSMFLDVLNWLDRMEIDPARNLRAMLLTEAYFRTIDSYRKVYTTPNGTLTLTISEGEDAYREQHTVALGVYHEANGLVEPVDPTSLEHEERMISRVDSRVYAQLIQQFIAENLTPSQQFVIEQRLFKQPPTHYDQIARLLGSGWTAEASRQAYSRP